jgi:omega-6 fatty acid desaturase (delta-12 desaturase)
VYEHGYVINAVDGLKTQNPVPWDRYAAAFDGSSFLQVHPLLKFFTLGIEYHHIHHLDIRVPGYSLQRCHDEAPVGLWDELGIVKLELADCWKSVFMTLWDEKRDVFVPFPPEEAPVLVTYMHMPPTHGHGHGHGHGAPRALSQTAPPT